MESKTEEQKINEESDKLYGANALARFETDLHEQKMYSIRRNIEAMCLIIKTANGTEKADQTIIAKAIVKINEHLNELTPSK